MGRVKLDDLDKYNTGSGDGRVNFFQLKDDGDTETVRIMLENDKDLEKCIYLTHKVMVGDKAKFPNKHVNCLRSYNDPIDKCPFCNSGEQYARPAVRLFIPVFNTSAEEVQFFDRPKGYVPKIQKMMRRYKDLPSHLFEIERNGEKGDKQTTYEFYETDEDETTLDDLPEIPEILGSAVLDASAEDMEYYLEAGEFPPMDKDDDEDDKPVRRRNKKKSKEEDDEELPYDEDSEDEDDEEEEEQPRRRKTKGKTERKSSRRSRRDEDEF